MISRAKKRPPFAKVSRERSFIICRKSQMVKSKFLPGMGMVVSSFTLSQLKFLI